MYQVVQEMAQIFTEPDFYTVGTNFAILYCIIYCILYYIILYDTLYNTPYYVNTFKIRL